MSTTWLRSMVQHEHSPRPRSTGMDINWPLNTPSSEHHDIRIVSIDVIPPIGYWFLSIKEPHDTVQYARNMTLASGRTLYEIWDFQTGSLVGFSIPIPIFLEARKYRDGKLDPADWQSLPRERRQEYVRTRQVVMDLFPEIPESSSKIITDNLHQQSYRGKISNLDVEREVVNHAKHSWTGYYSRVEQLQREGRTGMWEVEKEKVALKPRMRAILGGWMGERSVEFQERFFCRHSLMSSEVEIVNGPRTRIGGEPVLRGHLIWCEDNTGIAGLNMGPKELGEKKVRLFL